MISRRELLKTVGASVVAPGARWSTKRQGRDSDNARIAIGGQPVEILITPASPATTRISVVRAGSGATIHGDGSLVERQSPPPAGWIASLSREQTIRSGDLTIVIGRSTGADRSAEAFALSVRRSDGSTVQRLAVDGVTGALTFALGDGPLFGLGEGGPQFDRRGSTIGPRSGQGGYQLRTHGGRVPVQWIVGASGWAMFVHQPYGTFDLSGATGRFSSPGAAAAVPLDVFVVGARDPAAIVAEYAKLTGYPEMPPLWAFGYQQSHRTLASREEILAEAKTFRERKLPCATLIYLGTGFCPSGWNTDNGEFTFNPKVFPDPTAMLRALHDDHFKVVLHVVLEGRTLAGDVTDRCTAAPLPTGKSADGRWPDDRQVSCYWPAHKPLFDAGVDGWWPDQGDGLDPASRLARNRMYWGGPRQWRQDERPFALHRNGCAGMQRYAAFLWSGDVYSTWDTLKAHVPVAINTSMSGIPYWGSDIGGFVPTKDFTGELYVRWFQFGAFCPLFRAHGRTWKLRLPWGWNTGELGPDEISNYGGGAMNPAPEELHNAAVEPICRKYLELRARLMPYLYSVVHEGHVTGLPIVRALWLHYPDDRTAGSRGDEYLWGRDVIVAPVVEQGASKRDVYLPRGAWYDFWTGERHDGGREISRIVDLETMPLYVRSGAILPLGPVKQYTSEVRDEALTLRIHPGADGSFTMYEDDGVSFAHERGDWMGLEMRWSDADRRLDVRLAPGSRMRPPAERRFTAALAGTSSTRDLRFSGAPVQAQL